MLRLERALLQRVLKIMRQENAESHGAPRANNSGERHGGPPMGKNVRAIRDLLSDFDAVKARFGDGNSRYNCYERMLWRRNENFDKFQAERHPNGFTPSRTILPSELKICWRA